MWQERLPRQVWPPGYLGDKRVRHTSYSLGQPCCSLCPWLSSEWGFLGIAGRTQGATITGLKPISLLTPWHRGLLSLGECRRWTER